MGSTAPLSMFSRYSSFAVTSIPERLLLQVRSWDFTFHNIQIKLQKINELNNQIGKLPIKNKAIYKFQQIV